MSAATTATVSPARRVSGQIRVPGDKSISHRYALLAALAEGPSTISGYAPGADCRSTLDCLRALGVEIAAGDGGGALTIQGRGRAGFRAPASPLDAGNSGTTMRMLAGVLAGQSFSSTIAGDASLSRRPMRRVMEPLGRMGARIESTDGHAPLTIHGTVLHGVPYRQELPSAQVKSAVLFAGLHASGTTSVTEPADTRDHTERAFRAFGLQLKIDGRTISVAGGQHATGQVLSVPGDFSSAAFWMVAAAALPGSEMQIDGVGLNPTRTALLDVLRRFGARVEVRETGRLAEEPHGTVIVKSDRTGTIEIAPHEVPALIDELPAIAVLASHAGRVSVRGANELRVKESDRISVLVTGLRALGIQAEERPDGFIVSGSGAPSGGVADARGDHRMAMAFAVAALAGRHTSSIDGADSVIISYPDFFQTLERLVR